MQTCNFLADAANGNHIAIANSPGTGGDRDRRVWRGEGTEQRRIRVCGCNLHDPLCGHLMSIVHLYVLYDMICIQRCLVQTISLGRSCDDVELGQ